MPYRWFILRKNFSCLQTEEKNNLGWSLDCASLETSRQFICLMTSKLWNKWFRLVLFLSRDPCTLPQTLHQFTPLTTAQWKKSLNKLKGTWTCYLAVSLVIEVCPRGIGETLSVSWKLGGQSGNLIYQWQHFDVKSPAIWSYVKTLYLNLAIISIMWRHKINDGFTF